MMEPPVILVEAGMSHTSNFLSFHGFMSLENVSAASRNT